MVAKDIKFKENLEKALNNLDRYIFERVEDSSKSRLHSIAKASLAELITVSIEEAFQGSYDTMAEYGFSSFERDFKDNFLFAFEQGL